MQACLWGGLERCLQSIFGDVIGVLCAEDKECCYDEGENGPGGYKAEACQLIL